MRRCCAVAALALSGIVAGCADADHVDVTTVLSRGDCLTSDIGVKEIDYATLAAYRGTRLLGMTESPESDAHPVHLVAIVPAEYPTPGYSLAIDGEPAINDGELTVSIKVNNPPPDATLAQMITRPCLVVGVADRRVDRVRVVDDSAHPVGVLNLAPPKAP
jgi:hypothetical protein